MTQTLLGLIGGLCGTFLDGRYFLLLSPLVPAALHRSKTFEGLPSPKPAIGYGLSFALTLVLVFWLGIALNHSRGQTYTPSGLAEAISKKISPSTISTTEVITSQPQASKLSRAQSTSTSNLPSYKVGEDHTSIYPENFYEFLPYVWGFPPDRTMKFQMLMVDKYQIANRGKPQSPLTVAYLQGDVTSYSMALFIQRVFDGNGWAVEMVPRTDIGHIKGIYLFQDTIETQYDGAEEFKTFAKENQIPVAFGQQPGFTGQSHFEIWVGRGPDKAIPNRG